MSSSTYLPRSLYLQIDANETMDAIDAVNTFESWFNRTLTGWYMVATPAEEVKCASLHPALLTLARAHQLLIIGITIPIIFLQSKRRWRATNRPS